MARETIITLVDDLDGSTDDVQNVTFYDANGKRHKIDLSKENREELARIQAAVTDMLAGLVESAQPDKGNRPGKGDRPKPDKPSRTRGDRDELRAIREWARENGHQVSDRGRIAKPVREAYQAAH